MLLRAPSLHPFAEAGLFAFSVRFVTDNVEVALPDNPSSIGARIRPLGYARYKDYLASDHWREVRARYKASDRPQDCKCGATNVALHHKTYVRLGAEDLDDLEPLCPPCHRKAHGRSEKPRRRRKGKRNGEIKVKVDATIKGKPFHAPVVPRDTLVAHARCAG